MKIKIRLKLWALVGVSMLSVASSLAAAYTAVRPSVAGATQPTSGAIVNDTFDNTGQQGSAHVVNNNSAYECKAGISSGPTSSFGVINPIAAANGFTNQIASVQDLLANVKGVPSAAKSTFADAYSNNGAGDNMLFITFEGANPNSQNNALCESSSMVLMRKTTPDNGDTTDFYGFWDTGVPANGGINSQHNFVYIGATVDVTNKQVSFMLPSGYSRKGSFTLNLADPDTIIKAGGTYFPAGGTGGTPGSSAAACFESTGTSNANLKKCISATDPGEFIDAAHISYAGDTYTATGWGNASNQIVYQLTGPADKNRTAGGIPEIIMDTTQADTDINMDDKGSISDIKEIAAALKHAATGATLSMKSMKLNNVDISGDQTSAPIPVSGSGLPTFANYYPKDDTVELVFSKAGSNEDAYYGSYARKTGTNTFQLAGSNWGGKCANLAQMVFTSDPKTFTSPEREVGTMPADWQLNANDGPCSVGHVPIKVFVESADVDPPSAAASKTAGDSPEINCSVKLFNPLSWFLCPLATALETVVSQLDNEINNYLAITPGQPSYTASQQANCGNDQWCNYYDAWSVVRNISLGLIGVFALMAVVSQAMGFEILDAYTVRKVLPRLLVAAIGITLSWPLMMAFINFTNDVGLGVRQLIYAPFSGADAKVAFGGGGQFVSSFFAAGAIVALGFAGLLSFVATAALAAAVAFLVLTLRQMIIVMLVIFAPIALACYVLPNTNKVWKLWWDSFMRGLMMFPIIAAFIAIGRVFAAVNSHGGSINQIIAFTAYFAPYFLIPFTFRLAGGAVSTIAGIANDRSKGVFDRLSKGRSARMADRFQRAQNNQLWDTSSPVGKYANKAASWATAPVANAAYHGRNIPGLGKRGYQIATQLEHQATEQSTKAFEELNKAGFNDKAYRLLSGSHGAGKDANGNWIDDKTFSVATKQKLADAGLFGKQITSLSDFQKASEILGESTDSNERDAGDAIHGNMGRLATLYQDPEMGKASVQAAGLIGLAAHGFASGEDLARVGNDLEGSHGAGFAKSVLSTAQVAGTRSRPDIKAGYGVVKDPASGKWVSGISAQGGRAKSLLKTLGPDDLAGAKGGAFDALAPTIADTLDAGGGEAQAVEDQLFSWAGPYSRASVDVKGKAIDFINTRAAADPAFAQRWAASQNQRYNPAAQQQPGQQPPPPPPGPGQQPPPANPFASDRRLKRNISYMTTDAVSGIKLYRFKYLWSDQEYVGVMAQDLLESHPEAISTDELGFYRVDYSCLGLRMQTIENWLEKRQAETVET